MTFPPPAHNLDAEAGLIGCVLTTNACLPWLLEHVKPHHLFRDQHRVIWQAITEMHNLDRTVDTVTLTAHLQRTLQLKAAGGKAKLEECQCSASLSAVKDYARIVVDAWQWRCRLRAAYEQLEAVAAFDEAGWSKAIARTQDPRLQVTEEKPVPTLRRVA